MDNPACTEEPESKSSAPEVHLSQEELDFKAAQQLQEQLNSRESLPKRHLNTDHVFQHQIHITLVQAKLTRTHSFYGLSRMDPYVRMRFGHLLHQTPTAINGDRNPKWDQTIVCECIPGLQKFHVEIYDAKTFQSDQMIAQADIPLPRDIFKGVLIDEWFPLYSNEGEMGEGLINIVLSYRRVPLHFMDHQLNSLPVSALTEPVRIKPEDVLSLHALVPDLDEEIVRSVLVEKGGCKQSAADYLLCLASPEAHLPVESANDNSQKTATDSTNENDAV